MRALGYTFFPHPKGAAVSAGTAGVHSSLYVAVLDLETRGDSAVGSLGVRVRDLLTRFPLRDQFRTKSITPVNDASDLFLRRPFNETLPLRAN
jgi:hypothetical protein